MLWDTLNQGYMGKVAWMFSLTIHKEYDMIAGSHYWESRMATNTAVYTA